jgi:hypothetical protein
MDLIYMQGRIEFWTKIAEEFSKEPLSFSDYVCRKYIELESVTAVAKFLKENNYRKDNGTIYTSTDVSDILKNKPHESVNKIIFEFARSRYKHAKNYISNYQPKF